MKPRSFAVWAFAMMHASIFAALSFAYPLDAYEQTGIARLEAYRLAQEGKLSARAQPPGALLRNEKIDLRLSDRKNFEIPTPDGDFSAEINKLLVHDPKGYGVAVLDLSDLSRPRYCEVRGDYRANPGSVGKILIAMGLFQVLADLYPDSRHRAVADSADDPGDRR